MERKTAGINVERVEPWSCWGIRHVGFRHATSDLIRLSGADVWVTSPGVTHLESAVPFQQAERYRILATKATVDLDSDVRLPLGLRVDVFIQSGQK